MKTILFLYDLEDEKLWQDGLWAAVEILKQEYNVVKQNVHRLEALPWSGNVDFTIGWGAFGGPVDRILQQVPGKKALCLGGYAPYQNGTYDIIFYETEWSKRWLEQFPIKSTKLIHAFGTNTDIYKRNPTAPQIWDYITVGAFALWKRQNKLTEKKGNRLAIGQIQKNNLQESIDIIGNLMLDGIAISDMVDPLTLSKLYACSKKVYIPADLMGGGERAVLEARACFKKVEVEPDNPKLQELLTSPIWDHYYYAGQLKKGIQECI